MKTISIQEAKIEEIIIRPEAEIPISVAYRIFDDSGNLIAIKRINIPRVDALTQLNNIFSKILQYILSKEGL